jgi:hypothetical protein
VRKNKVLGWLAFIAVAVAAGAAHLRTPEAPVAVRAPVPASEAPRPSADRFATLPARDPIGKPRGTLFEVASPPKPAPAPVVVPEKPAAPPMPYRVAGKLLHDGTAQVVLARGDTVITASEGDTLDGGYRVEKIHANSVTLLYVPLGVTQDLPVVSVIDAEPRVAQTHTPQPPAAQPAASASNDKAKLRWDGPERVRAGDRFEVALRMTCAEAVRSTPLQIAFDANVLEAVDVRPGRFFAEGSFSYRVNPGGSIFVGASGKGAPAADAELFIVRFKPIRPAEAAELRVSALLLQSAAGRAVVHDQPAAFRTTITP